MAPNLGGSPLRVEGENRAQLRLRGVARIPSFPLWKAPLSIPSPARSRTFGCQ